MSTLADVRALMCTNRKWSKLSPDTARQIRRWKFIHPTAVLIKELTFEYHMQEDIDAAGLGAYEPGVVPHLCVETCGSDMFIIGHRRVAITREYPLIKFAYDDRDPHGWICGDLAQIRSDQRSGIRLGNVVTDQVDSSLFS